MKELYSIKWYLIESLILMAFIVLVQTSCHHKPVIPDTPSISFKKQIQPLFANNCALSGCHDGFEAKPLYYYNDIMLHIDPGNAHNSSIYQRITSLGPDAMPLTGSLSEEQIKLIYAWIMQGAKDN